MKENPLVSIVMPYYDSAAFLVEAVDSALSQTYENIEVIVVDDCSPKSNAKEICAHYKDRRLTIVRNSENLGLGATRNVAAQQARGTIFLPLDGDDRLDPNYVAETLAMLAPEDGGVYSQVNIFGDLNLLWIPDCTMINLMCGLPAPSTFLYRREVLDSVGGYSTEFYHADTEFLLRALRHGWKFRRLDKPLFFYRKHNQGMTSIHRSEEVPNLARLHKELFVEHLDEVLRTEESKYWAAKDEYQALEQGFQNVMGHYEQLQKNYDELLRKYQELEKSHYVHRLLNFVRRVARPRRPGMHAQ